MSLLVVFSLLMIPSAFSAQAAETPGIRKGEIVLGQSCALTGQAQAIGSGIRDGLLACFARTNSLGGVQGHTIRLISKDDGYEPDRAIRNSRELIFEDKVFLLIGSVGTPTSEAVVPLAEEAGVPLFGPLTGAEFLRQPCRDLVINIRGSYFQETEKLIEYLVDELDLIRISCFYQNDGFGRAGLDGVNRALSRRGLRLASEGTYVRNANAVKGGLLQIRRGDPQAVVMIGTYQPCAEFMKVAKGILPPEVVYGTISVAGSDDLIQELGQVAEGCVITQVVNHPDDLQTPLVQEFNEAMNEFRPGVKKGVVALEGYLTGRLFCQVLAEVQGEITRDSFLATVERIGTFDLGGTTLTYGPGDHQGMDQIFLTVVKDQQARPLEPGTNGSTITSERYP